MRVYLDNQGYARTGQPVYRGTYFGVGAPVYYYECENESGTLNAPDRASAILEARKRLGWLK